MMATLQARFRRSTAWLALVCPPLIAGHQVAHGQASGAPQFRTATTHSIQYYLSLPEGWGPGKKWPVVVVIESADREFLAAATEFAQARGHLPFILITPLVVTNGGAGYRSVPTYRYSTEVWDRVQRDGPFTFDLQGMLAVVRDVTKQYGGEERFFVTGLEAAGHTVWGVVFNHPEALRGAALVCPNYLGRWVDERHISSAPERANLPIRALVGSKDEVCAPGRPIYGQMQTALATAASHGYRNASLMPVEGAGHDRMPLVVLRYFSSLLPH